MSLQKAIEAYRGALPEGHLEEFALSDFDRLGVACRTATFTPEDGRVRGGTGYGLSDDAALVSALGEMSEEFSASRAVTTLPKESGSFAQMSARFGASNVADPRTLGLEAGSDYDENRTLQWFATQRLSDGATVWVPIEWVACYRGDVELEPLITPITNGLGAHLSREGAICHGLLELLQRDGNGVRFRALARGTALDLDSIDDAEIRSVLQKLDDANIEVCIKIASTDWGWTNVYAVGIDRVAGQGVPIMALGCGEACHPVPRFAVLKALLEFCAARSRLAFFHGPIETVQRLAPQGYWERIRPNLHPENEEPRALESMRQWIGFSYEQVRALLDQRVLRVDETVPFSSLPTVDEAAGDLENDKIALLKHLRERLESAGLEILVADFSQFAPGVHTVKVIVPGLEVETMSYGRIGERNVRRLMENAERGEVPLAGIGNAPQGAQRVHLTTESEARLGGAAWFDRAASSRVMGQFYSLYREPGRHSAPLLGRL